jgi:hypothetical protein
VRSTALLTASSMLTFDVPTTSINPYVRSMASNVAHDGRSSRTSDTVTG